MSRELSIQAHQPMPQRFGYAPTIDGYEVIDNDSGRPLGLPRATAQSANGTAQILNRAAVAGPKVLAAALGSA